jgi:DNA topoisomerase-1
MRLQHVSGTIAGITRVRRSNGFAYRPPAGVRRLDAKTLDRIRKLAIPAAYWPSQRRARPLD